jgi:uncharacterized membrane protein YqjE
MHPLLHVIATRPQLLAEHAQAYAELVAAELPRATAAWKRQALLNGLALLSLLASLLLGGVALMLWAALPAAAMPAAWLLIAVPLLPALAGIACLIAARSGTEANLLGDLRQQLGADAKMLHEAALAR